MERLLALHSKFYVLLNLGQATVAVEVVPMLDHGVHGCVCLTKSEGELRAFKWDQLRTRLPDGVALFSELHDENYLAQYNTAMLLAAQIYTSDTEMGDSVDQLAGILVGWITEKEGMPEVMTKAMARYKILEEAVGT